MARAVGKCSREEKDYELVYSEADTIIDHYSIEQILDDIKHGRIVDDIPQQRDANQWLAKDMSLLIHTVLINLAILPISMVKHGTGIGAIKKLIDGKQRTSIFMRFKNNEFALSKACPPVKMRRIIKEPKLDENGNIVKEKIQGKRNAVPVMIPCYNEDGTVMTEEFYYKIAGKYYEELPDSLKHQFNSYKNMPQCVHVNYTDDEMQLQMLRDNTSVKMTPGQIGVVVCGDELAEWKHSFRMHELFLNCSFWSDNQIKKDFIERCVVEAFILSMLDNQWKTSYPKNIDVFMENATDNNLLAYRDILDDLARVLQPYEEFRGNKLINNNNLHIIIAAYRRFCDFETRYKQSDFGAFLKKWFTEIKDTTDYEVKGNTSTKQKKTVTDKVKIMTDECEKYMKECGHLAPIGSEEYDTEGQVVESENNEEVELIADCQNVLADRIYDENTKTSFMNKSLMICSDFPNGDLNADTISRFRDYYSGLSDDDKDELSIKTEIDTSCIEAYLVEIPEDNCLNEEDNMLVLLNVLQNLRKEEVELSDKEIDNIIKAWIVKFADRLECDEIFASLTPEKDNYFMGRVSYVYRSIEDYMIKNFKEAI